MGSKACVPGTCCSLSKFAAIKHLCLQWLLYSFALYLVVSVVHEHIGRDEWETIVSMCMINFGIVAMQYDLWTMHKQRLTEMNINKVGPHA